MSTALLHRRLSAAMALSALMALMAGAGASPALLLTAAALGVATFRLPPPEWSAWIERASRLIIVGLCAWMLYVAFVLGEDFMPAVMAMLLFLLAAESLRAVDAKNDARLYLLSFALLLAATAYYPGLGFAASFVAFIVLSTLALMVGYLRRQSERFGMPGVRLGRRMMITIAAFSGLILLISASLFVLFPRLPRQWNVQGRRGGGETMAGFGNQVRLGAARRQHRRQPRGGVPGGVPRRHPRADGEPVLARPLVRPLRRRAVDAHAGGCWRPTFRRWTYARRWGGPLRRMRIFGGPPEASVLFGNHPHPERAAAVRHPRVPGLHGRRALHGDGRARLHHHLRRAPVPPDSRPAHQRRAGRCAHASVPAAAGAAWTRASSAWRTR